MTHKTPAIVKKASRLTGIPVGEITGPSRRSRVVRARFLCVLALRHTGYPFAAIGKVLGERDHSTIINAYNRAQEDADIVNQANHLIAMSPATEMTVSEEINHLKQRIESLEQRLI